jgi:hypothetical protein
VLPIKVAARSKGCTLFARSNSGIVGSNLTHGMDVCVRLFCLCVILCVGSGLVTGCSLVQRVLPTVYRTKKLKTRPRCNKRAAELQRDRYSIDFQLFLALRCSLLTVSIPSPNYILFASDIIDSLF